MALNLLNYRARLLKWHLVAWMLLRIAVYFPPVYAQNSYYETTFTTVNGLPHDNVLSIASDKTGFLWIGTWDGLSRFDGYEFHNYFHEPDNPESLPYFIARKLCVDRFNNVWIFHVDNVLSRYRRPTDDFYYFKPDEDSILDKTGVKDIETDKVGNLIVSGKGGIAVFDSSSGKFTRIPVYSSENLLLQLDIHKVTFDNENSIWLRTLTEFLKGKYLETDSGRYILISKRFSVLEDDFFPRPGHYLWNYRFMRLSDSSLWLISNSGIRKIPSGSHAQKLPEEPVPTDDYYWFRSQDSIRLVTPGENITIPLNPNETLQTLFLDPYGTVWYSTLYMSGMGTGLHRYNVTPEYFKHYLPEINGMPSVIYSIAKDNKGNILVGSKGAGFITCIDETGKLSRLNELNKDQVLLSDHVRSMIPVKDGILIGYMKCRLDFYNERKNSFTNVYTTSDPTYTREPYGFRTLFADSSGNLLVGTSGLFRYEPGKSNPFVPVWNNHAAGKNIYVLKSDNHGNIWAGSGGLLLKLNSNYFPDTVYSMGNIEYNIEDICFDSSGKIWLALLGGGLEFFDPETGDKEFYTTADGLSNNTTYSLLKDRYENLWITTNNGISRFNPVTGKFRIFGPTDGLKIHEFNSDAAFLDKEGRMYFGGMGGVVSFHPDSIIDVESEIRRTPLIITGFRVSGQSRYFDKAIYEAGIVSLEKGDDNFGITFACMDFKNPEKIHYRYRVIELSDEWTESDYLHRTINFTGLHPDTYTLEIQSTDISGNWNNRLELRIKIPPQFHQTLAFSILLLVIGLAILIFFFVLNSRQIRIKENQKQQHLKLESIRGQMNPHFIFNSLNSINYFIANNDRLAANRYISNFSKLIRSFLTNMSHEYISLSDEIESLEDYLHLEFLRFGDKFNYIISYVQLQPLDNWEVFPGMVQPFIENAIWHGVRGLQNRKGYIEVVFSTAKNNKIVCTITDDGIGRKLSAKTRTEAEKKKSRGINLIMERMHLINRLENRNYTVSIEDLYSNREESGTKIVVEIPSRMIMNKVQ